MTIKIIYNEKDFFNNSVQMEAECFFPEKEDIKKAFAYLKRNYDAAIHSGDYSFYYDDFSDFENGIITVVYYKEMYNKDITRMASDKAKKLFYSLFESESNS